MKGAKFPKISFLNIKNNLKEIVRGENIGYLSPYILWLAELL